MSALSGSNAFIGLIVCSGRKISWMDLQMMASRKNLPFLLSCKLFYSEVRLRVPSTP